MSIWWKTYTYTHRRHGYNMQGTGPQGPGLRTADLIYSSWYAWSRLQSCARIFHQCWLAPALAFGSTFYDFNKMYHIISYVPRILSTLQRVPNAKTNSSHWLPLRDVSRGPSSVIAAPFLFPLRAAWMSTSRQAGSPVYFYTTNQFRRSCSGGKADTPPTHTLSFPGTTHYPQAGDAFTLPELPCETKEKLQSPRVKNFRSAVWNSSRRILSWGSRLQSRIYSFALTYIILSARPLFAAGEAADREASCGTCVR